MLSLLFAIAAILYLIKLVNDKVVTIDLNEVFYALQSNGIKVLLVVLLMPVNWGIELFKWRKLISTHQYLSIPKSIQTILLGILMSLLSPNRTGELAGRLLHIKHEKRWQVFYVNMICSISQLNITLLGGLLALIFWSEEMSTMLPLSPNLIKLMGVLLIIISLYVYASSKALYFILKRLKKKFTNREITTISIKGRFEVLTYSLIRYLVFVVQFVLLLNIFSPSILLVDAGFMVSLIFLIVAVIPTAWIADFPVRTSLAYVVLTFFGYAGLTGLLASALLWTINLLLPAMIGLSVMPKVNWLSLVKLKKW